MELPYTWDYAKSGQAVCRGCQAYIVKGTLRFAIVQQRGPQNRYQPNWFHYHCFFLEHMPQSFIEIDKFDNLKWEDQENIKQIIAKQESPLTPPQIKKAISEANSKASLQNYIIEYTKFERSCKHCDEMICKHEIRIRKKRTKSKYHVYHLKCFIANHEELDFLECGSAINGFNNLSEEDQALVIEKLPGYETPAKKQRLSTDTALEKPLTQREMVSRDFNRIMYQYRNDLKALTKKEILELLQANKQIIPPKGARGIETLLDRACDLLTYGALTRCTDCELGQLVFCNFGYKCTGFVSEWTKCNFVIEEPVREYVTIPDNLILKYNFLSKYEYIPRQRIIERVEITDGLLKNKNFYIHGFSEEKTTALYNKVKLLAGRVVSNVRRSVFCVITTPEQVKLDTKIIQEAKEQNVYVVSEDFVNEIKTGACLDDIALEYSLVPWGCELHHRIPETYINQRPNTYRYFNETEEAGKRLMKVKNGIAIEPDSGLSEEAHVYQLGTTVYNAVLTKTDITCNKNSYYKIQLLEADNFNKYWLYTGWGRIGTRNGSSTPKEMDNLEMAKEAFKQKFERMTGNTWENRFAMEKKPHKYIFVDVNYQPKHYEIKDLNNQVADSTLKPAVAQLMAMIFNVQALEKMMLEYELDLQAMPVGKLSRSQIKTAYGILNEAIWALQSTYSQENIITFTNMFYSWMPTALKNPPLLDNLEIIKEKSYMLANLMEMETAYTIIQREANGESGNALDAYYNQLKAQIEPLEETSDEFKLIEQYAHNTHADTHRQYDLKILEIFKVAREGEKERYEKFNTLNNRRLLWHGSRTTNFAGILSQGLRIAPPEAPTSGYMFGKGIYFADMVSKSANYCFTSEEDSEGLLLLCEVALGNMHLKFKNEYVEELPPDVDSVWGVGKTEPDPDMMRTLGDGVQVPLGEPIWKEDVETKLKYNEFIVYDDSQVQIKYLLKVQFIY